MTSATPKLSRRERIERERFLMLLDAVEGVCVELRERYSEPGRSRSASALKDIAAALDAILTGDSAADAETIVRRAVIVYASQAMAAAPVAKDLFDVQFALIDPTPSEIRSDCRAILHDCTPEERQRRRVGSVDRIPQVHQLSKEA